MKLKVIFIFGHLLLSLMAFGQQNDLTTYQDIIFIINDSTSYKKTFTRQTQPQIDSLILSVYNEYVSLGFLHCRLDTLVGKTGIEAKVTLGQRACLQILSNDTLGSSAPFQRWSVATLNQQANQLLFPYEESGFPFAQLKVVELIQIPDSCYQIKWQVEPGPYITFDSIVFRSKDPLPIKYLKNYINLKKNSAYQESAIQIANEKLKQLSLLTVSQNPEIRFHDNKATVYFYGNKKKSNYFNGIVGIRPDENTEKIFITGDVEIKLFNALNKAEKLDLTWKKLQPETQDLTAQLGLPFIFNLPIGLSGKINIYRRDSTFTSNKSKLGIVIPLGANNEIEGFFEKNNSNRLTNFTNNLSGNSRQNFYGLRINLEKLDYTFNPRIGWKIETSIGIGDRTADNNEDSSTETRTLVWKPELEVEWYIPTFKRQGLKIASNSSLMEGSNFFQNELFRIGGLRSIRGFMEESLFASSYSVASFEYRFLPELNTAFYFFSDFAWYEAQTTTYFNTDTPISFGLGTNFATKAGIFTFNYALGQQFNNPILLRYAKISFGFRNVF
jgi:outer membrane protein assembly factor BamA